MLSEDQTELNILKFRTNLNLCVLRNWAAQILLGEGALGRVEELGWANLPCTLTGSPTA